MKIVTIYPSTIKVKLVYKHKGTYKLNIQFHNHNFTLQNPMQINQNQIKPKPNKKEAKSKQHPGFAASLLRYY